MNRSAPTVADLDENFALKADAVILAFKARGFATHIRESGGEGNPDDYDEMASMITRLVWRVPS